MHRLRAPDGRGRSFREAEVAHLARLDELLHRADRLLDRRVGIDTMLVVKVDRVNAEPLERRVAGRVDVLGLAVSAEPRAVGCADVAELRREHDLVAPARYRLADELLVRADAVHVCRIEERHADLERSVDRRDRLSLIRGTVELGHPHAAEALSGDLEPL